MARSPLPPREIDICHRLRVWREQHKIRRTDFASRLDLRPDSYANYEYCRAPISYGMAYKILAVFAINARWMCTGEGPEDVSVPIPTPEALGVSPRVLFSKVFDDHLSEEVAKQTEAVTNSMEYRYGSVGAGGVPTERARWFFQDYLVRQISRWMVEVPDDKIEPFTNQVFHFGMELAASYEHDTLAVIESRRLKLEAFRLLMDQRFREVGIRPRRKVAT